MSQHSDLGGRILAHAFHDELEKIAGMKISPRWIRNRIKGVPKKIERLREGRTGERVGKAVGSGAGAWRGMIREGVPWPGSEAQMERMVRSAQSGGATGEAAGKQLDKVLNKVLRAAGIVKTKTAAEKTAAGEQIWRRAVRSVPGKKGREIKKGSGEYIRFMEHHGPSSRLPHGQGMRQADVSGPAGNTKPWYDQAGRSAKAIEKELKKGKKPYKRSALSKKDLRKLEWYGTTGKGRSGGKSIRARMKLKGRKLSERLDDWLD